MRLIDNKQRSLNTQCTAVGYTTLYIQVTAKASMIFALICIEHYTEIWREYVGYNIDLDLAPVISSSDSDDMLDLMDYNVETCLQLNRKSCGSTLKV